MIANLTETETFQFQVSDKITPAFTSLIITSLLIVVIYILYYSKIRNIKKNIYPRSFAFIFQIYIEFIHNLLIQILGPKFEKLTPYFIFLFTYILFCNIISVFGFESPTSSLTITLSLGMVTWIGIFVVGFKYQKLGFLKKYMFNLSINGKKIPVMINPLNILSQFAPLISLSFRLWGNIFAGGIIISMVLGGTGNISSQIPFLRLFDLFGAIVLVPLHAYFDILSGFIQAFVFTLLTMVYWKMEAVEMDDENIKQAEEIIKDEASQALPERGAGQLAIAA